MYMYMGWQVTQRDVKNSGYSLHLHFWLLTSEKLTYFGELIKGNTPALIQGNAHSELSCKSVTLGTKVLPAIKFRTIWYYCVQLSPCYFYSDPFYGGKIPL